MSKLYHSFPVGHASLTVEHKTDVKSPVTVSTVDLWSPLTEAGL